MKRFYSISAVGEEGGSNDLMEQCGTIDLNIEVCEYKYSGIRSVWDFILKSVFSVITNMVEDLFAIWRLIWHWKKKVETWEVLTCSGLKRYLHP